MADIPVFNMSLLSITGYSTSKEILIATASYGNKRWDKRVRKIYEILRYQKKKN